MTRIQIINSKDFKQWKRYVSTERLLLSIRNAKNNVKTQNYENNIKRKEKIS